MSHLDAVVVDPTRIDACCAQRYVIDTDRMLDELAEGPFKVRVRWLALEMLQAAVGERWSAAVAAAAEVRALLVLRTLGCER